MLVWSGKAQLDHTGDELCETMKRHQQPKKDLDFRKLKSIHYEYFVFRKKKTYLAP
jgi:hypothetical protein